MTEAEFRASVARGYARANAGREPSAPELDEIVERVRAETRIVFSAPSGADSFRASGAAAQHDEEPADDFDPATMSILREFQSKGPEFAAAATQATRDFFALRASRAVGMTTGGLRRFILAHPAMAQAAGDCTFVGR